MAKRKYEIEESTKKLNEEEQRKSMIKAIKSGYKVTEPAQAHICNNFNRLFNDKFHMQGNTKTQQIPCFSLPSIYIQKHFLLVLKNNPQLWEQVPAEKMTEFKIFVEYMKKNKMCVNCKECRKECYNIKAYRQYDTKGICDLRQLYRIIIKKDVVINDIVDASINTKNVRLNGSGEIHNKLILEVYKKVAKMNPDTRFFTYTKNFELLAENKRLPKNLSINLSVFGEYTKNKLEAVKGELPKKLNRFITVEENEFKEILKDKTKKVCPAYDKSKKVSCATCRLCTVAKGIDIYCKKH